MTLPSSPGSFGPLRATIFLTILAAAGAACTQRLPDPVPVAQPGGLARTLQATGTPDLPRLIDFKWRYRGREGRFSGEGGVRINPPDSVRLDLFGPGWSGVQSAVLVGDDIYYIGEQKITLPPPTFMWSMLGIFRPPTGIEPQGARRGEYSQLTYRLSDRESVVYLFDAEGLLVEAELKRNDDAVQTIRVVPGDPGEDPEAFRWPNEGRYRDLVEFLEVQFNVVGTRDHEPFESRIFQAAAR